jgi:hypothetical protein
LNNLLTLEDNYLSCLLNGGDIQDIALTAHHEYIHGEIKRLKDKGFVAIPKGTIPGTDRFYEQDLSDSLAAYYADEVREAQKKQAVKTVFENVNSNMPADMLIGSLREELDKISEQTGRNDIKNAAEIRDTVYQNTEFIIDKILPIGMTLLIGAPKMGKSWLLLLWAECITLGIPVFGYKIHRSPVLYYTLEDSIKRCKYRLNKIGTHWSRYLFFSETTRGTIGIINDIKKTRARVIIIDTFGAFVTVKDGNDYNETTQRIREIKEIADVMQVAIIVVHHTRKGDDGGDWTSAVLGSQGLVGAADNIVSLQRKRGEDKAKLAVTGRDIPDTYINLQWDDGTWIRQN